MVAFAPPAPLVVAGFAPTSGAVGSNVTITGTGFTGATNVSLCFVDTLFTVVSSTRVTAVVPAGACDGRWRVTTPAGTGASDGAFTVLPPPAVTGFSPSAGPVGATVTLTGTGFSGATNVSLCFVETTFTVASSTQVTAKVPAGACDGRWRVTTSLGTGASDGAFTVTATGPAISGFSPGSGAVGSTVTITGTGLTGATSVSLCLVETTFTVLSSTQVTARVPAEACNGRWRITNASGTGVSDGVFTLSGPTITGFSPGSGSVGSTVTITGTGFSGATSVSLCFAETTFTVISATQVTARVPSGACDGRWRVTTSDGTGVSDGAFTVT
jgi:hypothetical protein